MQTVLALLFPGDHRRTRAEIAFRTGVLLFLVIWSARYFTIRLVDLGNDPGWMHVVHLVIHEAGHTITAMLTENHAAVVFMGSGPQVLLPLVVALSFFLVNKDAYGAALGLGWTGHALLDVAPYIQDARMLNLQLLSGGTGREVEGHDWEYLLEHWHILHRDIILAANVVTAAWWIMVVAFLWGAASIVYDASMRDAPDLLAEE